MKPLPLLVLLLSCFIGAAAMAADGPKFKDFPAGLYQGPIAKPKLDTDQEIEFEEQIREAARQAINFGGENIFASWKTGRDSVYGAVINARTGDVVLWPYPICCWKKTDKPFYIKKDSRLIVFAGMLTEEGPGGVHYFEFADGEFKLISSPDVQNVAEVAPAAGVPEEAEGDRVAFQADARTKLLFAKYLVTAISQASFNEKSEEVAALFSPEMMQRYAGVLLGSAVRLAISGGEVRYELLYNRISDVFILARYEGAKITSFGMVTATKVSAEVFGVPDQENYFSLMLIQRPQLFRRLAIELKDGQPPEKLFSQYVFDKAESDLLKANLLAGLELIAFASKDRCKQAAVAYLQANRITYSGTPSTAPVYVTMGLRSPDGRVLAFADKETNRRFGYFIYDEAADHCRPTRVLTSSY